jgi:sigma-B regulation protein RsbU (phosphoserine phosphatase)
MAKTISHIQQYSEAFTDPSKGMALLNNALEAGNSNCMFVTLFFGVLDLRNGVLRFSSAGHTPPSLVRGGRSGPVAQERGPALGLAEDQDFPENSIQLHAGDRLLIYTDGIDEAFNDQAQMYGCERLDRELERTHEEPIAEAGINIIQAVDDFAGSTPQSDDICLMLIDIPDKTVPQESATAARSFLPGPSLTGSVGDWLRGELGKLSLDEVLIMELMLVGEEVITNIAKYGRLPDRSEIEVGIFIESDKSSIHLEFSDAGPAFNPLTQAEGAKRGSDIESAEIGGLGVHLITGLTDHQQYWRRGQRNILRVTKAQG